MTVMLHVHITSFYTSDTYTFHYIVIVILKSLLYAYGCLLKLKCFCSSNIIYDYCFIILTFWHNRMHYID